MSCLPEEPAPVRFSFCGLTRSSRVNFLIYGPRLRSFRNLIGILVLILLIAGCGKHKAQVKAPRPSGPGSQTGSTNPTPSPSQPAPAGSSRSVQSEPQKPASDAVTPSLEFPAGPPIRIGLVTSGKEIRISSGSGYYFQEKIPESARQQVQGEVQLRVEQEMEKTSSVYRVQLASFKKMEMAEDLRDKLAEFYSEPVTIHENQNLGTVQVRIGAYATREEAQAFVKIMARAGYRDAFIVREAVSAGGGTMTLALRGQNDLFRISRAGFLFFPASATSFLSLNGKPYRGIFDITLNRNSQITVVNQLGMEEYLPGVVPAEMSPSSYPEAAALAAQAIAARTYALKNLGSFRSEGYDLTPDDRSQVYGGAAAERDATNEAVRQTSGMAIYYQDKLINAMFMSTCGGRTEDFSNVFDAPPVPYLTSVFCSIESGTAKGEILLEGKHEISEMISSDDGSIVNRNIELARLLGILEPGSDVSLESLSAASTKEEVMLWVENARKAARKNSSGELPTKTDLGTRAGFLRYATESFFGAAEIRRKISTGDAGYYMSNLGDGNSIPEEARFALAYLMQSNLWRPYPDNTVRPGAPVRRSEALSFLLRCVESAQPEILRKGTFAGVNSDESGAAPDPSLKIKWANRTQEVALSNKVRLFRLDSERATPVSYVRIIGNEKLRFHLDSLGKIDFLEVELNPTGASSDRYSPSATWDVTLTRSAIAEKLRSLAAGVGEFKDLTPYRIGNSGRAVQIQITGTRGSAIFNGYKVKNALGLKDTLFTITRENSPDGAIASFTFHGRGYGHGVGLCQVGAYGMARAGRSYEEILKAYYKGVEIRKAY
jgi:stage II sporulation protein D